MANFRLLDPGRKFTDSNGDPASGYQLFVYDAGTTTKATSYKDSAGAAIHTNPIVLESDGGLPNRELWVPTGSYKLVLASDTDTDPPSSGTTIGDNLDPINDVSENSASEWVASGLTPTYVDGDTFTVPGDQTTTLHAGRRLQITDSGGTVYATISSSSYSSSTTVNLTVDGEDTIDSGISAVSYGLVGASNSSAPGGIEHILTASVSSAASIDIDVNNSDYIAYEVHFHNILPATNAVNLYCRLSNDGGSTFEADASDYRWVYSILIASGSPTFTPSGDNADSEIQLYNNQGNTTNEYFTGVVRIANPMNASLMTRVGWEGSYWAGSSNFYDVDGYANYETAEQTDAVQFLFSSGNVASASYTVYGIRER